MAARHWISFLNRRYALVILDVMMPKMDGLADMQGDQAVFQGADYHADGKK